jgi:diaminopropionate ammonia-lyase
MATVLVNPLRDVAAIAGSPGGEPRRFHRRLPGYVPTPLVDAAGVAGRVMARHVYVKDESNRLGLPAFKVLGASWATYRLLTRSLGREPAWRDVTELRAALAPLGPVTLVTATDGNHGRALARVARWFGCGARILVPAGTSAARIDAIASEGATVDVVDGSYDDAVSAAAALASDSTLVVSDTAWEGYTDVSQWVIDGYSTIFIECDEQLAGAQPDVVVVQLGVGALAAAVVRHYAGRAAIVGVEPVSAACHLESARAGTPVTVPGPHSSIMVGMNCGNVSPVAWPAVSSGIDVFLAIDDAPAEAAMRELAEEGVVAGETGAAGVAALHALAAKGVLDVRGTSVLVLNTEGATDPASYARIVGRAAS